MFKKQEGITLVALVITIIVLLILAGVSISLVVGNNGVLTQASTAVVTNKIADAREALNMALASTETIYYGKWTSNTGMQRDVVYITDGTLKTQLENLGYKLYNFTAIGTEQTIILTNNANEAFQLKVTINENTGKSIIDPDIQLYSKATIQNVDDVETATVDTEDLLFPASESAE